MAMANAKKTQKTTASHQRQQKTNTHSTHSHNHPTKSPNQKEEIEVIGTRTSKCDICKATKKTYLLNYGFSLCADCIDVCAMILEQLQLDETQPLTNKAVKPKPTECIATGE